MADINLHALNLQSKWPRLAKLLQDRAGFQRRYQKASAQVQTLTAHVPRARAADLDAEAAAVRLGRKPPESTHEADAKRDLERAIRERDVLARTVQAVEEEYGNYLAQHQSALFGDVLQARHAVALGLAEHARAALSDYARWADLAKTVKDLTPSVPVDENAPSQRLTTAFIGVHAAQPSGISRGTVEQVLGYLSDLAPEPREGEDAAA